jgi:hypothetical protein
MSNSMHDPGADRRQTIQLEPLMSDDEARREVGWVAREALALMSNNVPWSSLDHPQRVALLARADEYAARKRAVLAYIEARR